MPEESGITDPYDLVLRDLYTKRDQINGAIAAIEAMRGGQGSAAPVTGVAGAAAAQRPESVGARGLRQ